MIDVIRYLDHKSLVRSRSLELKLLIPKQEERVRYRNEHFLDTTAERNILESLKREYRYLTGREYG